VSGLLSKGLTAPVTVFTAGQFEMASAVRAIQRTQNVGLAVTGGVLAFYCLTPDLSNVKPVKIPKSSLFDATESPAGSLGEVS
jgi:hypothetical protein